MVTATAATVVASHGKLVISGVEETASTMVSTLSSVLKTSAPIPIDTAAQLTAASPISMHITLRAHTGKLVGTVNTAVQTCAWDGAGATLTCPIVAYDGDLAPDTQVVGSYATVNLAFSVAVLPTKLSSTPAGRRRLQQSTTTCSATSQSYTWSESCIPPYIGTGFSSLEQESFPGADGGAVSSSSVAAATTWLFNSLPVFNASSIYTYLANGAATYQPISIGTASSSSSSTYSSQDMLTSLQQSENLSGFYDGLACSASESYSQSVATFSSQSTASAQGSLFNQVGQASMPSLVRGEGAELLFYLFQRETRAPPGAAGQLTVIRRLPPVAASRSPVATSSNSPNF